MTRKLYENWMSTVDSATYKLTLYLVTPELYSDPTPLHDDSQLGSSAVIVAESGVTGGYGIDNVLMQSTIVGSSLTAGVAMGIIQFDLHEPLAFKLLDRVLSFTKVFGFEGMQSARYVLKFEFLGRNKTTGKVEKFPGIHFHSLVIQTISAQVTTQGTVYNIVAQTKTGIVARETELYETITVRGVASLESFSRNLEHALNNVYVPHMRLSEDYDPNIKIGKYIIRIHSEDNPATEYLDNADNILAFPESVLKSSWASAAKAAVAQSSADDAIGVVTETISPGTNLIPYLEQTITKNATGYIEWLKKKANAEEVSPLPIVKVIPILKETNKSDPQTGEPISDIILVIACEESWIGEQSTRYSQEQLLSSVTYQNERFNAIPLKKKYSYLYSGENTEVLDFKIMFDQAFYSAKYPMDGKLYTSGAKTFPGAETKTISTTSNDSSYTEFGVDNKPSFWTPDGYTKTNLLSGITYIEDLEPVTGTYVELINYKYDIMNPSDYKMTQVIDSDLSDDYMIALRAREHHNRQGNGIKAELSIKGDPYWLGTPGVEIAFSQPVTSTLGQADVATVSDISMKDYAFTGDIMIALVTYNPDESIAKPGAKFERQMDMISSGVYRVQRVETRFSGGEFTQTLECFRDRNVATTTVAQQLDLL